MGKGNSPDWLPSENVLILFCERDLEIILV